MGGRKPRQLSQKAATLVAAFDMASRAVGKDASGDQITAADLAHLKAFDNLRKYITRLERFRETTIRKGLPK